MTLRREVVLAICRAVAKGICDPETAAATINGDNESVFYRLGKNDEIEKIPDGEVWNVFDAP